MSRIEDDIIALWSRLFPVPGYTSGYQQELTQLFLFTQQNLEKAQREISDLLPRIQEISDSDLRFTARRLLILFQQTLKVIRPSTAVQTCGDGIWYILLKKDDRQGWVKSYLQSVSTVLDFEINRWQSQSFTIEVKRQCLDAANYLTGCLNTLIAHVSSLQDLGKKIEKQIKEYEQIFYVPGLDTNDPALLLKIFKKYKAPAKPAPSYPAVLASLYNLNLSADEIDEMGMRLLNRDMKVTIDLAKQNAAILGLPESSTIQEVWSALSKYYNVDEHMGAVAKKVVAVCNRYGNEAIIQIDPTDQLYFEKTPDYMASLVTGGQDIAVDYLTDRPVSYLYYTPGKNSSLLTMINILVHEASHGFNFVKSAQHAGSPLLNLATPMQDAMTEGMAYYREYQYWVAAETLLGETNLDQAAQAYLDLYGKTKEAQTRAVLGAKLETYIWRVIRDIRALCDTHVNGGKQNYIDFLQWASKATQISEEFLHGECFVFLSQPGYAPCYMVGCDSYSKYQVMGLNNGITEKKYNTLASNMGFYPWTLGVKKLEAIATGNSI